jgi:hypothetical protein
LLLPSVGVLYDPRVQAPLHAREKVTYFLWSTPKTPLRWYTAVVSLSKAEHEVVQQNQEAILWLVASFRARQQNQLLRRKTKKSIV